MTKKWFYNLIYGIVAEHTDHLYTVYRLIDQNDNEVGKFESSKKPSKGDKIILNNSVLKIKPKMFVVTEVYISQSSFTGVLKGTIQKLDSKYY